MKFGSKSKAVSLLTSLTSVILNGILSITILSHFSDVRSNVWNSVESLSNDKNVGVKSEIKFV